MLHSSADATPPTTEDNSSQCIYAIEVPHNRMSHVERAYQEYLKKLQQQSGYAFFSAEQKDQFDKQYAVERFPNYQAFQKSPYGKLNFFSQSYTKETVEIIVLKFQEKKDADEFINSLEQQGITCKIINKPANNIEMAPLRRQP